MEDLTGQRFGRLVVIRRADKLSGHNQRWLCQCDCGNTSISSGWSMKNGEVKSCGCYSRERASICNSGSGNAMWKGDKVSLSSLHQWVRYHKPKPELCEVCGIKKAKDVASVTHAYSRDLTEYKWMCRSCHVKHDYSANGRTRTRCKASLQVLRRRRKSRRLDSPYPSRNAKMVSPIVPVPD